MGLKKSADLNFNERKLSADFFHAGLCKLEACFIVIFRMGLLDNLLALKIDLTVFDCLSFEIRIDDFKIFADSDNICLDVGLELIINFGALDLKITFFFDATDFLRIFESGLFLFEFSISTN